ncbi:MAG TPA: multicopper oxidase domain-containing protein, partial [Candidatus Limnocylindrales bacterium]|nr:multicopper oxidase domain-containing protein [Candidatus Limnocylindrales bacterium]
MRKQFATLALTIAVIATLTLSNVLISTSSASSTSSSGPTLDPRTIPKYVSQLVVPPVYTPTLEVDPVSGAVVQQDYTVDMVQFSQQILPAGFPATQVWGYAGMTYDPLTGQQLGYIEHSPAATFETVRGIPVQVTWVNKITQPSMFAVDPTIMWANPNNMATVTQSFSPFPPGYAQAQSPVPLVPHLHGAEDQSTSDGGPQAWFTASGIHGPDYNTYTPTAVNAAVDYYPNDQPATTLWYHDHALGMTRLNVLAGLAGFYMIRDPNDPIAPLLPSGQYEIPLAIQDRSFNLDGSLWFSSVGDNPDVHPYWQPEFFGNAIMVNGVVWPNLNVQPHQYRFRVLDGSNARFYTLTFTYHMGGKDILVPFTQMGTEGGYLRTPASMTSLLIAPGQRADILVDFSTIPSGTHIIMKNTGKAPFPAGSPPDPTTTGQIMQFTVGSGTPVPPAALPAILNNIPVLTPDSPARTLVLYEVESSTDEPLMVTLQGQTFDAPVSETPRVGSTEDWMIVDITGDAHPIHLHLVQFQVISRQALNTAKYTDDWVALNGEPPLDHPTLTLPVDNYLQGKPMPAMPNENGWKDTVIVYPGQVTIIRVRFAPLTAP